MTEKLFTSLFANKIRDRHGNLKRDFEYHRNLRTNTGIDWQACAMGDYQTIAGTATSTTATTIVDSTGLGAIGTFNSTTTPGGIVGHLVVALVDVNTIRYGVIVSTVNNTATIDKWYDPASPGGAAGSTPSGTSKYAVLPGGAPHWFLALTADATAPAAGDTTLTSELTTNGFIRALATSRAHSAGVNTYTVVKTFTCSGGSTTINKEAVFNAVLGGYMPFESAEPSPPTLVSGDTIAQTITVTI